MLAGIGANTVSLCGTVQADAFFSHQTHDKRFFMLSVSVSRHSGACDTVNVILPEDKLLAADTSVGAKVRVSGQLRSYNNKTDTGNRLILTVYAAQLDNAGEGPENSVQLEGVICKQPVFRKTPLGREICDVILAVGRKYGRVDYLPCILWGSAARLCAGLDTGRRIRLGGRLQSRKYMKLIDGKLSEKTAFEVSVSELEMLE